LTPEEKKMANTTATLYIRSKDGLSKAPKKPADLPEGSTYYLYWYEGGTKRKAANVGRFADAARVARNNKVAELGNAAIEKAKPQPPVHESETKPEAESKPEVNVPVVVRQAVVDYLKAVEGRIGRDGYGASPRTLQAYRGRLAYLLEFDGVTPLTSVDKKYFERFRLFLRSRLESDRYVYNVLQATNIFFRTLGITSCAVVMREAGMGAPKKVEAYKPEQLNRFFLECSPTEELIFKTFLHTMGREREVANTEAGDLLNTENIWWIQPKAHRRFRLKGKRSGQAARGRKVPLPRQFTATLKTYCEGKQPHDLLFPNTEGRVQGHFLTMCKRIAKRADMNPDEWNLHKFRKTGATLHYKGGIPVTTISTWLGHESVAVTMAYLDISDAADEHHVDMVSNGACAAWA
jgi:integrase